MSLDLTSELPDQAAYERVKLARHPERPHTLDYVERLFEDFTEVHGDRRFADDPAVICGMARFQGTAVAIIGHQKGRETKQILRRNFGMPKPEGYRKALRFMRLAEKFGRPLLTFIDTPGAYPGIDAEERGQSEAIALNLREMARLKVPVIVTIIGEGGSGGALAIGVGDSILMLENAVFSVITPEGCAAILWREEAGQAETRPRVVALAAQFLRLTAAELHQMGVIDTIVKEPEGGAHSSYDECAQAIGIALQASLKEASSFSDQERLRRRYQKLRAMGDWRN